ncbi:hypothetical protein F5882DRAFT_16181 [Hyaloscypha sp. PMI_1271]|nr:hypothetical protein F5882DRAFT_16181 [Hyaloscypha sp. PMI_1271]
MSTLDKISSYTAIRLGLLSFSFLRISYALSQRELPVAKSSLMSTACLPVALWDISPAAVVPVLFGAVRVAVSAWTGVVILVDKAACSRGRRATFARACKHEEGRASSL